MEGSKSVGARRKCRMGGRNGNELPLACSCSLASLMKVFPREKGVLVELTTLKPPI